VTDAPLVPLVHHVTLTVTDPERSAQWYEALLGPAAVVRREGPTWVRVRLQWPTGLIIGLTRHEGKADPADRFDHTRVGLDHVGLDCGSEAEVRAWLARLDELGVGHGPLEDVPYGWAVTARDPDDIPIEFFADKHPPQTPTLPEG
jgi:glyoxylase I family protein